MNERERDTVLAALRMWQSRGNRPLALDEIATNGNEHTSLDAEEIDELCERLNVPEEQPTLVAFIEGGILHAAHANQPVELIIVDYDTDGVDSDRLSTLPNGESATVTNCHVSTDDEHVTVNEYKALA